MKKHKMVILATGEYGSDSGRPRYLVACLICDVIVHVATTGPAIRVREHMDEQNMGEFPINADTMTWIHQQFQGEPL
jgi:F420-dependent methylenetetrahydromethanopterin dehydrogenase